MDAPHDPSSTGGQLPVDLYTYARALLEVPGTESQPLAPLQNLCRCVTEQLDLVATVVRLIPQAGDAGLVVAAEAGALILGDLETTLGEGPGQTAHRTRRPVFATDVTGRGGEQWPGFSSAAGAAGIGAVYAVPLSVGAAALGTLEAFATASSPLLPRQLALLLIFGELATEYLLDQRHPVEGPRAREVMRALDHRAEIAQAQGMTMIDLGVDLPEALARLRAHAFARGLTLHDLARQVVAGYQLPPDIAPEQP